MKRVGSVLVFKPGVTRAEAETALKKIAGLLDPNYFLKSWEDPTRVPFRVEEFDDRYGGPVWYIP